MDGEPEGEARQAQADGDADLGEQVVEAAAAHLRGWPAGPGACRGRYPRAVRRRGEGGGAASGRRALRALACAAAFASACALLGPRPLPPALLGELAGRAEAARGLRFEAPVEAAVVSRRRLRALLASELDAGASADDFARAEAVGRALGLIAPGVDLRAALLDLQERSVAGFYTPLRRRLVLVLDGRVRAPLPAAADAVALHELVHSLQDQHSQLLAVLLGLEDHDDLAFAIGALLEGDALRAAFRERASREGVAPPSAADFAAAFRDQPAAAVDLALPRFLRDAFLLQYPHGYALAEALEGAGGTAALDAALRDPPLSSEEILHPEGYLGARAREPLAFLGLEAGDLGRAGCREVGSNTFGELGLRAFALERGAAEQAASAAAAGWGGDRAVVLDCAGEAAFAWLVRFDGAGDADEFASLARPLLRPGEGAEVDGRRVLLSRALAPEARRRALAAPVAEHRDLAAYLSARPQVLARAERLRRVAGAAARP